MEPGSGKVKVCLGSLGATAHPPHDRDSSAALGRGADSAAAGKRKREGGRRARPGPSCPDDRAGRRRALPSHGKPRRGARAWLPEEGGRAARSLGTDCPRAAAVALPPRPQALESFASLHANCLRPRARSGWDRWRPCSRSWGCGISLGKGRMLAALRGEAH